jgi:uncharacterized glyoxalase superfamily protein PhnB
MLCMSTLAKSCPSTLVSALRYRDALTAIDWLITAFGFEKHAVYLGEDGKTVMHAQLTFGNGMIMLGSADNGSKASEYMVQPDETGMRSTQSIYVIVTDADAVYATAKAAGSAILIDIADARHGGRGFTCRDLEGHAWSFGTYDPWEPA